MGRRSGWDMERSAATERAEGYDLDLHTPALTDWPSGADCRCQPAYELGCLQQAWLASQTECAYGALAL